MSQVPVKLSGLEVALKLLAAAVLLAVLALDLAFHGFDHHIYVLFDDFTTLLFGVAAVLRWFRDRAHYELKERLIDVFSSIPFSMFFSDDPFFHAVLIGLQCLKFASMVNVYQYFHIRKENMELTRWHRAFMVLICLCLVLHTMSCLWILVSPTAKEDGLTTYIRALYYIVTTVATVGYGDIVPTTNQGRLFSIAAMLIGVVGYSLLVAQTSRLLLEYDKRKSVMREKLEVLESFLKHYDIPNDLQKAIYGFYTHRLQAKLNDLERELLNDLPSALENELQIYMNIKPLSKISLFGSCSRPLLMEASTLLEHKYYAPGEALIEKGQRGHEMFVIGHGSVRIIKDNIVVGLLKDGESFGELSLIYEGVRQATILANTYCDVFKLSGESFHALLAKYPELRENVDHILAEREKKKR